ncbi:MAG: hypothetical protein R3Y65_04715 [Bacillota bacterium]
MNFEIENVILVEISTVILLFLRELMYKMTVFDVEWNKMESFVTGKIVTLVLL